MKKSIRTQEYSENYNAEISHLRVASSEPIHILLVDDRPENLQALVAVLEGQNYNLITAASGEEALRYVLKIDFAVILLDVQMPGMDGIQTARLIKAREKARHIPILFITAANQAPEHVRSGYEAGAVDYIFKPFAPENLRQKVDAFVKLYLNHQYVQRLVNERTAALHEANQRLREEIAERTRIAEGFHKVFEASPCIMTIISQRDHRIVQANQSWQRYTGYDPNEVIGKIFDWKNCLHFCESENASGLPQQMDEIIHNARVAYTTKAGDKREALLSTEHVEIGREPCLLLVLMDISERVLFEKEMSRLDRLYLIGEMAAGIAHEIRNPMTTIRGFLQMSKRQNQFTPQHIDIMLEELDRANSIITEFLNLARDKRVERKNQPINEIVQALFPLLQAEALVSGKTVELNLKPCPDLLLDEKEIRQLILNLSMNGLEAMPAGGTLSVATYVQDRSVILKVQDQGKGIPEEILEKITVPFFTTKETGTGLGLPICYSVAHRHDARIRVKTGAEGTAFLVRFPIR